MTDCLLLELRAERDWCYQSHFPGPSDAMDGICEPPWMGLRRVLENDSGSANRRKKNRQRPGPL